MQFICSHFQPNLRCLVLLIAPTCKMPGSLRLSERSQHRLRAYGAPYSLVEMAIFMGTVLGPQQPRDLDLLEVFAGRKALSKEFQAKGLEVETFEIEDDAQKFDLLSDEGMLRAVGLTLRLKVGALLFGGHPCSTFVWLSRGSTRRSASRPLGDPLCAAAQKANQMASRFSLLILLAVARGAVWLVEQPCSSLLKNHPRFSLLETLGRAGTIPDPRQVRFWMGLYGAKTPKPSYLLGDACITKCYSDRSSLHMQVWRYTPFCYIHMCHCFRPYIGAMENHLQQCDRRRFDSEGVVVRYRDRAGRPKLSGPKKGC